MRLLIQWLINWPESVARHLTWLAPLFARITVGWVFLWSGGAKLNSLPQVTENFIGWGIPYAQVLAPFVAGVEFFGGLFLLLGLFSRISAGALGITMMVAIRSAKWGDVDSLETLLGSMSSSTSRYFCGLPSQDQALCRWIICYSASLDAAP